MTNKNKDKKTQSDICIDLLKVICAFLIVLLHTYCHDTNSTIDWIHDILCNIAVPFFFIVSGYYFTDGLKKSESPTLFIRKYLKRMGTMYLFWTIITLPVAWYKIIGISYHGAAIWFKILYLIRLFFLTGSLGIYWYILSLIYGCIMLYWAFLHNKIWILSTFAIICFSYGLVYDAGWLDGTMGYHIIHVIWGSTRNVFNIGLLYLIIGFLLNRHKTKIHWLIALAGLIVSLFCYTLTKGIIFNGIWHIICASLLFIFGKNFQITPCFNTRPWRKYSTALYLCQFPFILCFDFYLQRGTAIDFVSTLLFCSLIFILLEKFGSSKFLRIVWG